MAENVEYKFTEEETQAAAMQEEIERLRAENGHLSNRVVFLRALVNQLTAHAHADAQLPGEPEAPVAVTEEQPDDAAVANAPGA